MNSRGDLDLTHIEAAEILDVADAHFGRLYTVAPGARVFLFANPPSSKLHKAALAKGVVQVPVLHGEKFPAILIDAKGTAIACIEQELGPDHQVLAREVPGREDVLEIVTFKRKHTGRADMPETGEAIEILHRGYMHADSRQSLSDAHYQESFKRINGDIFPHDNLVDDVRQSIFGDCFFLSSLLAILSREDGERYIKSMMHQVEGTNKVIVRLFDPQVKRFFYYSIDNSEHCINGKTTVTHRAPWVHVLEKAYTAHSMKRKIVVEQNKKYDYTYPAFREMFGNGGDAMTAMRIITGEESDEISIPESAGYPWDSQSFLYARSVYLHIKALYDVCDAREMRQWDSSLDELFSNELGKLALEGLRENLAALFENYGDKEINLADISAQLTRMKGLPPLNPVRERLLDTISTKLSSVPPEQVIWVLEAYKQYIADYLKLKEERDIPINSALNSVRLLVNLGAYINQMFEGDLVDHVVRDEDGRQVVTRCTAWEKFSEEAHLDEVNPSLEAILAGYNGFRKYVASDARSPDLEEVIQAFDLMFKDTNNHDLRWSGALGTGLYSQSTLNLYDRINRFFIDRDANIFLVASSRDNVPQSAGVKPQHCYSIIGVSEKMVNGHLLKFIRIRNPWGHTGIRYDWNAEHELRDGNKSVASEVRDGYAEFDVELSDFAKFFGRYSVGRFDSPRLRNVAIADMRGEQELYSPIRADARNQPAPARDWSDVAKIAGFVAGAVIGGLAAAAFAFILLPMLMTTWVVASIAIVVAGASVGALLGLEIGERAERAIRSRRAARAYEYQRIPSDIEQQSSMPASRASHRQDSPASDFRVPASQSSGKAKLFSPLASAAEAEVRGRENDDRLERESEVARPNKRK